LVAAAEGVSRRDLANECFAIKSADADAFIATTDDGYRANQSRPGGAAVFYLKPSGLGTYLPHDQDGKLLGARGTEAVDRADAPGAFTEWALPRASKRSFAIRSTATGREIVISPAGLLVQTDAAASGRARRFTFVPAQGCRPFPEAEVDATGKRFRGRDRHQSLFGFADAHLHITADQRAGGRVIYGEPFDRFGITEALGHDADVHGPDGGLDITGNLLRTGLPFGIHDTHGWPTFAGWPVHDTNTHQQDYYVWLKRAWKAGLRLTVAQTVEDAPLCEIEPVRSHSCDETATVKLQIRRLRLLQDYVDAQSGGPGKGWFRLVYSPRQARRAIERGKLAVLIGVESSNLFGCSELMDEPECTRADIDRGIREFRRLGVRTVFPIHWVDNAFGGAAIEGGDKGTFINIFNAFQTGHFLRTGPCPEPGQGEEMRTLSPVELQVLSSFFPATKPLAAQGMPTYPPGPQCNTKGLTRLGGYLIRQLIKQHMLIEADHLSERARARVLEIAEAHHYPLISSHTGTGGVWTPSQLERLYAIGGFATATPDTAPELATKILGLRPGSIPQHSFGVPLGTDTGGFSSLPGPREDAGKRPLQYPFRAFHCDITFQRQRTGQRVYDLNADGVAHYGLLADLIADVRQQPDGEKATRVLFRSSETYVRMWRHAARHR
jgi:microsomal dipeptidase-like Zn-dependent dipeptidase